MKTPSPKPPAKDEKARAALPPAAWIAGLVALLVASIAVYFD